MILIEKKMTYTILFILCQKVKIYQELSVLLNHLSLKNDHFILCYCYSLYSIKWVSYERY